MTDQEQSQNQLTNSAAVAATPATPAAPPPPSQSESFADFAAALNAENTGDGDSTGTETPEVTDQDAQGEVEGAGALPPETPEEKAHKSAQERINKAVAKQRAAERRADAAEASIRAMEVRFAGLEARVNGTLPSTAPKPDPNAPNPDDYEFRDVDTRYLADLSRYEARKAIAEDRQQEQAVLTRRQQEAAAQQFQANLEALEAKGAALHEDFSDVVFGDVPISKTIADLTFDSEHGPAIIYDLASNIEEAKKVSAMSPARQAAWFGRKEAERSSATPGAGVTPKVSQAPRPLSMTARGSSGTQRIDASTTDFSAFERMVKQQRK